MNRSARPLDAAALDAASVDAASFSTADLCAVAAPIRSARRWWWPTLILMGLLWLLDAQGLAQGLGSMPLHFVGYALLGLCAGRARGSFVGGWLLAAWFGVLSQVQLAFLPGQVAGIGSWLVMLLASGLGSRLGVRLRQSRRAGASAVPAAQARRV